MLPACWAHQPCYKIITTCSRLVLNNECGHILLTSWEIFTRFHCLPCLKQDELSDELSFLCPSSSRRAIHLSVVQTGLNNNFRVNKFPYQCYIIIKSPNTLSNTQYNLTHINYLSDHIFASPLVPRKLRSANLNLEVFHRHFYPPDFYQVRFHSWKF